MRLSRFTCILPAGAHTITVHPLNRQLLFYLLLIVDDENTCFERLGADQL
jgi:hypothetical protein